MSAFTPPPAAIRHADSGLDEMVKTLEELLVTRQALVRALRRAHGAPLTGAAVPNAPLIPAVILEAELVALTARQELLLTKLAVLFPPA
jgi:hypothetical protein